MYIFYILDCRKSSLWLYEDIQVTYLAKHLVYSKHFIMSTHRNLEHYSQPSGFHDGWRTVTRGRRHAFLKSPIPAAKSKSDHLMITQFLHVPGGDKKSTAK